MLMVVWKWLVFPWVYPIFMLPMAAIGLIVKPLQSGCVLIATALYFLWAPLAFGFVGLIALFALYDIMNPRPGKTRKDELAFLTLTVGWVGGFLVAMVYLQSFNGVLRWFAAATIGYYGGTVLMSYGELIASGGKSDYERELDRIMDGAKREAAT